MRGLEYPARFALVLLDGDPPGISLLRDAVTTASFVIAADGASRTLLQRQLRIEAVVGDLDSITASDKKQLDLSGVKVVASHDQYTNDFEKALSYVLDLGIDSALIFGAGGKRLDHTLANISVLLRFTSKFRDIKLVDDHGYHFCLLPEQGSLNLATEVGQLISLSPLGLAKGVRTTGLQYSLDDENLQMGKREGLSNVAIGSAVTIALERGALLVSVHMATMEA